jgi:hypothetical protein
MRDLLQSAVNIPAQHLSFKAKSLKLVNLTPSLINQGNNKCVRPTHFIV